jgi:hypothetical protein
MYEFLLKQEICSLLMNHYLIDMLILEIRLVQIQQWYLYIQYNKITSRKNPWNLCIAICLIEYSFVWKLCIYLTANRVQCYDICQGENPYKCDQFIFYSTSFIELSWCQFDCFWKIFIAMILIKKSKVNLFCHKSFFVTSCFYRSYASVISLTQSSINARS